VSISDCIESEILADGSLDYAANVLERFDFVVASTMAGSN
jgi:histidinol phosphatase-like PHP family hydrolase